MGPNTTALTPASAHTHDAAAAMPVHAAAGAPYARPELIRVDVTSTAASPFRPGGDGATLDAS